MRCIHYFIVFFALVLGSCSDYEKTAIKEDPKNIHPFGTEVNLQENWFTSVKIDTSTTNLGLTNVIPTIDTTIVLDWKYMGEVGSKKLVKFDNFYPPMSQSKMNVHSYKKHANYSLKKLSGKPVKIPALFEEQPLTPWTYRDNAVEDISFLDVDQGMPGSYIQSMTFDTYGDMWLGTFGNGFGKFNGYSFFKVKDLPFSNTVWDLVTEENGKNIFIATYSTSFFVYDGHNFYDYASVFKLKDNEFINSIKVSGNQVIAGSNNNNFFIRNSENQWSKIVFEDDFNVHDLQSFLFIKDTIFILSSNALYKLKDGVLSKSSLSINDDILYGTVSNGNISLLTKKEIIVVNENYYQNHYFEDKFAESFKSEIYFKNQQYFITTETGVIEIRADWKSRLLTTDDGLSINQINNLIYKDDNFYFATNGGGLCKFKSNSFKHYNPSNGLEDFIVKNIINLKGNKSIFSAYPSSIYEIENGSLRSLLPENLRMNSPIYALEEVENGDIWFSIWKEGIFKISGNSVYKLNPEFFQTQRVRSLKQDRHGKIWLATFSGLITLEISEKTLKVKRYNAKSGLRTENMFEVAFGNQDSVFVATENGLFVFPDGRKDQIIQYSEKNGLVSEEIITMYFDKKNSALWLGTQSAGLCKIQNNLISVWDETSGLSSNTVVSIQNIGGNKFYLGTEKGLTYADFENGKEKFKIYRKKDGLKSIDFFRSAINLDYENRLWLGSGKSLVSLPITRTESSQKMSKILISKVETFDSKIDADNKSKSEYDLILDYQKNHFAIHFYVPNPQRKTIKYAYRFKEEGDVWIELGEDRKVDFKKLDYGAHHLEFRAALSDPEIYVYRTFDVYINKPWWQTLWVKIIALIIIFLIIRQFISYREKRLLNRQRELEDEVESRTIELQSEKLKVEVKNKEILDSIQYSKRIQSALMPKSQKLIESVGAGFLYYAPKDIVAGDFYWLHETDNDLYVAIADCTGHGVPGALVSIVCINALNRALNEFKISEPSKILDKTRELIIKEFQKSGNNVKDGMDISILRKQKGTNQIYWSGANNPLWILRKGEILEFKADRQPVAYFEYAKEFTQHEITLEADDIVFMLTDGFQDQFGGDKSKKLKSTGLKNLILNASHLNSKEMESYLSNAFYQWKKDLEQVDDVCIFGFKN